MPELRPALIVYEGLPISSGGAHRIRESRPSVVWRRLHGFLDRFADAVAFSYLNVAVLDDLHAPEAVTRVVKSADARFGQHARRELVTGVERVDLITWPLSLDHMEGAIAWVEDQEALSASSLGPAVGIDFKLTFFFKDPDTGQRLPFQEPEYYDNQAFGETPLGTSWMHTRLSSRSTCAADLFLPFVEIDEPARTYIARIQQQLPFKLSHRNWTCMQLNRADAHYYAHRIAAPAPSA